MSPRFRLFFEAQRRGPFAFGDPNVEQRAHVLARQRRVGATLDRGDGQRLVPSLSPPLSFQKVLQVPQLFPGLPSIALQSGQLAQVHAQ